MKELFLKNIGHFLIFLRFGDPKLRDLSKLWSWWS